MYKSYICPICESRLVGQRYCPSCHKLVEPLVYSGRYLPNEHSDRCLVEPRKMQAKVAVKTKQNKSEWKKQRPKEEKKTGKAGILSIIAVIIGLLPAILSFAGIFADEFLDININPEDYSNPEFIQAVLDNYIDKNTDAYDETGYASYYVDEDFVNEWNEPGTGYQCFDVDYEGLVDKFGYYDMGEGDSEYSVDLFGTNYKTYYNHSINLSDGDKNDIEIEYDEVSKQVIQVRYEQSLEDSDIDYQIPLSIANYLDSYAAVTEEVLQKMALAAKDGSESPDVEGMSIYVDEYEDTITWSFEKN